MFAKQCQPSCSFQRAIEPLAVQGAVHDFLRGRWNRKGARCRKIDTRTRKRKPVGSPSGTHQSAIARLSLAPGRWPKPNKGHWERPLNRRYEQPAGKPLVRGWNSAILGNRGRYRALPIKGKTLLVKQSVSKVGAPGKEYYFPKSV